MSILINPKFFINREVVDKVKTFMHDMFDPIINIIGTPYFGMNSLYQNEIPLSNFIIKPHRSLF